MQAMDVSNNQGTGREFYKGVISERELQRIQDKFCLSTGVSAICVSKNGDLVSRVSGKEGETERIWAMIPRVQFEEIVARVSEDSLEDQVVEDFEDNIKLAAISIKIEGTLVITWVVVGEMQEENSEKHFYESLDLLREVSQTIFRSKLGIVNAEAESRRSRFQEVEMSENLRRIEATTEVVGLLDSDDTIEAVLEKVLMVVGEHLQISSAQVYQIYRDGATMDVVTEWCAKGIVSFFDRTKNLPAIHFITSEKPIVLSSDSRGSFLYKSELDEREIKAFVSFPMLQHGNTGMYVCFTQTDRDRIWRVEDVKFIADAIKVMQSILTRRIQKNSLASSYASLEAVLDNVACGIYVKDVASGQVLFANRNFKNTFSEEMRDGTINLLLDNGVPSRRNQVSHEISRISNGQWFDLMNTQITWVDGRKAELYSLYDITDKKIYQKKIEQQAYTDFLTGLYNRMCCERDLARHIDEANKRGEKGALLYLDLDDFKHINDGLGHQYGDVLLKSISHSLKRIDGIENTCYRMGGDEFVIVIPSENFLKFEEIIEDIKHIFSKPWFLKDADYYCTMSMGIVNFPDDGESVQDLIKKADIAMYEAKKSGKNRVANYSDNIDTASNRRLDMEKNMRDATVAGYEEFEVYYQPIIDIQLNGTPCTGAEALIRWNSSELGFIPPSDFIPLAEYLGLINPIGNHVLRQACETCRQWNDNGRPNYKVNVNLSVVQLLQADIVDIVERTVRETGINPHNLTLEVTESLAINDMERMKEILSSIKKLGVRIALDDFGTGYSSLNHIREIPFDVIKVDQGFVKDLSEDVYSQSFIKMVAELADTIGVSICVEGIETKEQYHVLEGMKVRLVQGYFFDRPMKQVDFERKYLQNNK